MPPFHLPSRRRSQAVPINSCFPHCRYSSAYSESCEERWQPGEPPPAMHSQRCPVAKLRAAAQQNTKGPGYSDVPHGLFGLRDPKPPKEKFRRSQKERSAKSPEKASFFQKFHGDAAPPPLPPHPQMYSEDAWHPAFVPDDQQVLFNDARRLVGRPGEYLIYNENCAVHGHRRASSGHYILPKSASCPAPARPFTRQSMDVERLKNWRRNSLTLTAPRSQGDASRQRAASSERHTSKPSSRFRYDHYDLSSSSSESSTPSLLTPSSSSSAVKSASPDDPHNRRSQFRRAWSLFIGCDESPKEKPPPQRILRQPTRHVYRRGISGLPIECTNRYLGVAF